MTLTSKIAQNTFWQMIAKIIGAAISGWILILLTRQLTQEEFGFYGTALSLTQFIAIIYDLGLYVVCLKEISTDPNNQKNIFNNFLGLRIFTTLALSIISLIIIWQLPYNSLVKEMSIIFSLGFLFSGLAQLLTAIYQKELSMTTVAMAETIGKIIMLIFIILLLNQKIYLPWIAMSSLASALTVTLWLWVKAGKYFIIKPYFSLLEWKKLIPLIWPVTVGILLNLVYFKIDTIILSLVKPAQDVAIYTAPYKILEIIVTFPHMFMGLVMPIMSFAWANKNQQRLNLIIQKITTLFLIICFPLLIIGYFSGGKIMTLFAGSEYQNSGLIMFPLMIATSAIFVGTAYTYLIVTINKQKDMLVYYGSAAILAVILYIWLIPKYTYFGAAWVTAGIEIFIAITAWLLIKKHLNLKLNYLPFFKILIASLIFFIILYITNDMFIIYQLIISGIFYLLALLLTKTLNIQDIKQLIKQN